MIRDLIQEIIDLLGGTCRPITKNEEAGVFVYSSPLSIESAKEAFTTHPRLMQNRWVNSQRFTTLPFIIEYTGENLYAQVVVDVERADSASVTWVVRTLTFLVPREGGAPLMASNVTQAGEALRRLYTQPQSEA